MGSIINLSRVTPHTHQFSDIDGYIGVEENSGLVLEGDSRRVSFTDFQSISPNFLFKNILLKGKKANFLSNTSVLAGSASSVSNITIDQDSIKFTASGAASISFITDFSKELKSLFGVIIKSSLPGTMVFTSNLSSGDTLNESVEFDEGETSKVLYDHSSDVTLDFGEKALIKFSVVGEGEVSVKFLAFYTVDRFISNNVHNFLTEDGSEIYPSNTYCAESMSYTPGSNKSAEMPIYSVHIPDANTNRLVKEFKLFNSGDKPVQIGELWFSPGINYASLSELLYCGIKEEGQGAFDYPTNEREYVRSNNSVLINILNEDTPSTVFELAFRFRTIDAGSYTFYTTYENLTTYPYITIYNESTTNIVADSGASGFSVQADLEADTQYRVVFKGTLASLVNRYISFNDIKFYLNEGSDGASISNWVAPGKCVLLSEILNETLYQNTYDVLSGLYYKVLDIFNFSPQGEVSIARTSTSTTISSTKEINSNSLGIMDNQFVLYTNNFENRYLCNIVDGSIIADGVLPENFYNCFIVARCEPQLEYYRNIPDFRFLSTTSYIELSCGCSLSYVSTDTTTKTLYQVLEKEPLIGTQYLDFCNNNSGLFDYAEYSAVNDLICPDWTNKGFVETGRGPVLISARHPINSTAKRSIPVAVAVPVISSEAVYTFYKVFMKSPSNEQSIFDTSDHDWMMITDSGTIQYLKFRRSSLKYEDVLDNFYVQESDKIFIKERSFDINGTIVCFELPTTKLGVEKVIINATILSSTGVNIFVWTLEIDTSTTNEIKYNVLSANDIGVGIEVGVFAEPNEDVKFYLKSKNGEILEKILFDNIFIFHPSGELSSTDVKVYQEEVDFSTLKIPLFQSVAVPIYTSSVSITEAEWGSPVDGVYRKTLNIPNIVTNSVITSVSSTVWECGDVSFSISSSDTLTISTKYPGDFVADISFYTTSI